MTMSDFQLITGFAILLSGYTQLQCGISVYHWERVVRLAWLSSITHLCCLTFLRDHFCLNRRAQIWRLPAMILLIVALCVAMVPAVRIYTSPQKTISAVVSGSPRYYYQIDHAVCFFGYHPNDARDHFLNTGFDYLQAKQQRAILSMVTLIFGMLSRLWRLYPMPVNAYIRMRQWLSHRFRSWLQVIFDRTKSDTFLSFGVRGLIYRPLLAAFLVVRILADISVSKAFEVSQSVTLGTKQ